LGHKTIEKQPKKTKKNLKQITNRSNKLQKGKKFKKLKIAVAKLTTLRQFIRFSPLYLWEKRENIRDYVKKRIFCFKPRLNPAAQWSCTCACSAVTWTAGGPASGGPGRARAGRRAPGGRTARTDPWTSSSGCSPRCSSNKHDD
jgi:hypothetical protein